MKLATLIEHRRRVRASVEHLSRTLQTTPYGWPSLAELAEVARISPYHYIRVYQRAVGETPQATVRRLKLEAARSRLAQAGASRVSDVALDYGYESAQAFSRAFHKQFGCTPGAQRSQREDFGGGVQTWIAELPSLALQALDLPRDDGGVSEVFDQIMGRLDHAGVPRFAQDMFCVVSPDLRLAGAAALQNRWVDRSLGLASQAHGGGLHLCACGQPDAVWRRLRQSAAAQSRDPGRPILLRYLNDPAYKARVEQRVEIYVPLRVPAGQIREAGLQEKPIVKSAAANTAPDPRSALRR